MRLKLLILSQQLHYSGQVFLVHCLEPSVIKSSRGCAESLITVKIVVPPSLSIGQNLVRGYNLLEFFFGPTMVRAICSAFIRVISQRQLAVGGLDDGEVGVTRDAEDMVAAGAGHGLQQSVG